MEPRTIGGFFAKGCTIGRAIPKTDDPELKIDLSNVRPEDRDDFYQALLEQRQYLDRE